MLVDSPSLGLASFRFLFGKAVAVVDLAFDDMLIFQHLPVHVSKEFLLSPKKMLELFNIHCPPVSFVVSQRLELFTETFFEDL